MSSPDAYKTLQVDPEAEDEVIVAAYRRLARKYHPDTAPDPESAARMAAINAAWELIGTPEKRATYDLARRADRSRPSAGAEASSASGSRSHSAPPRPAPGPPPTSAASGPAAGPPPRATPPPESVSRDWTTGRSTVGGGYEASMRTADGTGAAGPPPGNPSGAVLNFGRYAGWSLGEIARRDLEYLEWLDRAPIGRQYRDEIDAILRRSGRRRSSDDAGREQRGLFRRR